MIKLEEGEKVIMEVRRHWFVISTTGAFLFMLAIVPIPLLILALNTFPEIGVVISDQRFTAILALFGSTWLLVIWVMFFMAWTDYYLDILVITNKRLIDIEQYGFFRREVATIPMSSIQDIKIEIKGPIRTLLKFGNLIVQTAGQFQELIIRDINHPALVKQTILSAHHDAVVKQN